LLALLLIVALMFIAAMAIVPEIKFEIQHDREDEMIHRGVQYSRAIRAYYKKFGRYPTRLEDLDNTNNLRFLRKRYKDPVNCKNGKCEDFKLLHFGEVKMSSSIGIAGGSIPGANSLNGQANGGLNGPGGFSQPSGFGGGSSFGGGGGFGGNSGGGFGGNTNSIGSSLSSSGQPGADSQSSPPTQPGPSQPGFGPSGSGQPGQPSSSDPSGQGANGQPGPAGSISSGQLGGQQFGGGPIVGVVSTSKQTGYHEFNHKKKYEEWQFIYDPAGDRGGLIKTPYQPSLPGFGQQQQLQQPGQTQQQNGFPPTTSGPIPNMQNNPNPGMEPNPPTQTPNQQ
jgi:hypothetical protein